MTIPNVILGSDVDPVWGNAVADALNAAPLGIVGYASRSTNFGGFVATTLTVMEATFTAVADRYYRTTIMGEVGTSVALDIPVLTITDSSNVQKARWTSRLESTSTVSYYSSLVETGLSGSVTRRLRAVRAAGTGICDIQAASDRIAYLMVEDLGSNL